jgi:uncharacterized membrane protein YeaQ/YmgE (transglycosylase-associated protein family)
VIGLIIGYLITGLVIGALARLVVPGRNPIGLPMTILLGIVGALAGGLIAHAIGLGAVLTFVVAVALAALLVSMMSGASRHRGVGV